MNKTRLFSIICLSIASICLLFPAGGFADPPVVITHSSVAAGSVDADAIKKIYSGYMTKWPDNSRIIVTAMEKAAIHEDFLKAYVGKTKSQFKATWKKLMFTGKGKYPKSFNSADELINYVKSTPGAIGYVNAEANPQGVSVQ